MGWQDLDKTKFTIQTGDGAVHFPNNLNSSFSVEYNVSQFNFPKLTGTFINRQNPMGAVYNLEICFQGADHVSKAQDFRKSAENKNNWVVTHPYYGKIYVQPIAALFFDNSLKGMNMTRITGPVMETINITKLAATPDAVSAIASSKVLVDNLFAGSYINIIPQPKVSDVSAMRGNTSSFYQALKTISTDANVIIKAYKATNNAVDNAFANASNAIATMQAFISLPATIAITIANRVRYITDEFNGIAAQVKNLHTPSLKALWQNNAGTTLSSLCLASTYNIGANDYLYSVDALNVIAGIVGVYNTYVSSLEVLQTTNGGELDSFMPDGASVQALTNLVNYTISTLLTIASNAKQQRIFILTKDNNWINIAYQIYGLLPDDSTITQIMADNNAGLNEMLQVQKGRQIIYYV